MAFASLAKTKKVFTHPKARSAKIQLRENVLDAIGASNARVLDLFAGPGTMYRQVWSRAASYVGCDLNWYRDERRVFAADNLRVLRVLDLGAFNVFDVDAFGSPWEQMELLAKRRKLAPGEVIAVVWTDGSYLKLRCGALPKALARMTGMPEKLPLACRAQDMICDKALDKFCELLTGKVLRLWTAQSQSQSQVRYYAAMIGSVA